MAASPHSPHPGTIDVYEVVPGGDTAQDPSVAYDTVSYEPIINAYETLVNYNGSDPGTFVPTLATCVPGTPQCGLDYPGEPVGETNLVTYSAGAPVAFTYVIDPAAKFYDWHTGHSWGVFPSDVMFSLSRTAAFTDLPGVASQPGWIQTQALVPFGNGSWDGGIHAPYNNTPNQVLSSMLINDSAYGCTNTVLAHSHGCITFLATGGGQSWPFFNQLTADNLGASIEPCGWFTAQSAGVPGWAGSGAASGDGPCALPNGGNNTSNAAWTTYVSGLSPTSWDAFEELSFSTPAIQPNVQFLQVGSGPYYAQISPYTSYTLTASPAYAEPSGCTGLGGLHTYSGYCDPAPGTYQPNVNVFWKSDDSFGISQYQAGQADFAGLLTTHTSTLLSLASAGKLNIYQAGSISSFFLPFNLNFSKATYIADSFPSGASINIPADFFSHMAARQFLVHSYDYNTTEKTAWTVDGLQFLFQAGGPIPVGMAPYYPANVSFPTGDADSNAGHTGSAGYWWHVGITPGSGYFDPEMYACAHNTTCVFPISGESGAPGLDTGIDNWITSVNTISGGKMAPFRIDETFHTLIVKQLIKGPGAGPLPVWNLGWAPDYPDPTDYMAPMAYPDNTYTFSDAVAEQFAAPAFDNTGVCGHSTATFSNLAFWASAAFNSSCSGVAYTLANDYNQIAAGLPVGPTRTLDYNLVSHILNTLGLYVWYGQSNNIFSAAPWIDGNSVNTNIMIGGGGDQIWFQIKYTPFEVHATFKATGLPAGTNWSMTAGSPPTLKQNKTVGALGTLVFNAPANATFTYTISPPAGYGLARVIGTGTTTQTSTNVLAVAKTITLQFGKLETLNFNESAIAGRQMASGSHWSVTLTPVFGGAGPAGQVGSNVTSGLTGTISFTVPKGAEYKYAISKPAVYRAIPPHGIVVVPAAPSTHLIQFLLLTAVVEIKETGLAAGTAWGATVTGPMNVTINNTAAIKVFHLENGSYTYTVANFSAKHPHPSHGGFVVTVPHVPLVITITYNSTPAPFAANAAGGVAAPSKWLMAATPFGREVG